MRAERTAPLRNPFGRLARGLSRLPASATTAIGVALTLAAGLLDLLTGPELASLTFYLLPVVLVARGGTKWQAALTGTLASVMWAVAEALRGRNYDSGALFAWASLTRLAVLLTIALLVQRVGAPAPEHDVVDTEAACPYCGSTDTLALQVGLVCRGCKRLSE